MFRTIIAASVVGFALLAQGCAGTTQKSTLVFDPGRGTCQDTLHGLTWQAESSSEIATLAEANAYVAKLNRESGYSDWRLPTIYELYDLSYTFDLHQNGDCKLQFEGKYWSGEKDGDGMVGAWEIADQCDPERQYFPGGPGLVRAVRP